MRIITVEQKDKKSLIQRQLKNIILYYLLRFLQTFLQWLKSWSITELKTLL